MVRYPQGHLSPTLTLTLTLCLTRVCTVVPRRLTVSSGGRRGSSATLFCFVFITDRRSHTTIHSTVGDRAFPVAAARIWNGLGLPSTSLLRLRCLSFGHASRLISSPFPIPVPDHVQCSRSDTFILDTLIVHVAYLLDYLLTLGCLGSVVVRTSDS